MIVCVLGMHKSGTSLLAETLHHAGVHMADVAEDLGYDDDNKHERHEAQRINRRLLAPVSIPTLRGYRLRNAGVNRAGYEVNLDSLSWVRRTKLEHVLARADGREIAALADELNRAHEHWGFKDPRTALTYDVWRRNLPAHRLIAVYRPLDQVLRRYRITSRTPIKAVRVARSWLLHNEMILRHVAASDDAFLTRYDVLMGDDDEMRRIERYLGIPLPDRRDPAMYRARRSSDGAPEFPVPIPGPLRRRVDRIDARVSELRRCP